VFRSKKFRLLLPAYLLVLCGFLVSGLWLNKSVTVFVESSSIDLGTCIVVDAGHGGVDGGATSCTGILESKFNLDVALRVNDLLHLLGRRTIMIRSEDISIYTEGESIAAKKISDLKERVRIVNETESAVLLSIHMNYFSDSRYYGPQVFYADTENSKSYAEAIQSALNSNLGSANKRTIKKASGIYLLEHIESPGILIECGFLSNQEEEAKLRDPEYQKKLSCLIAATTSTFLMNA